MKCLQLHHREILRRLVDGEKQCEIAREMGLSEQSVSRIVNDPAFQEVLSRVEVNIEDAVAEIRIGLSREVGREAIGFVGQLLDDEKAPPSLRFKAARLVFDKLGLRESEGN